MVKQVIELKHGLKIGKEIHKDVEIKEITAGDIIEASEAAERVYLTPEGPIVLTSPSKVTFEILTRQIVRIGTLQAPVSGEEIKKLHAEDFEILRDAADNLEAAVVAAEQRGRV